jgi:hypothetical protein
MQIFFLERYISVKNTGRTSMLQLRPSTSVALIFPALAARVCGGGFSLQPVVRLMAWDR